MSATRREEVVEFSRGKYQDRGVWDRGFLDDNDRGYEIPLARDTRLLVRWLNGRMLFVSNGVSVTYDGRDDRMTRRSG